MAGLRHDRDARAAPRGRAGWEEEQSDWRGNARSDLVFTWPDGRMIHPQRISKWFTRHVKDAGPQRIRLHG